MQYDASPWDEEGWELLLKNCRSELLEEHYFAATPDCTIAWKSFSPSAEPSKPSLDRSGCGIMPSTLRPSLQMPAMLSSDPFGFAAAVRSPLGV